MFEIFDIKTRVRMAILLYLQPTVLDCVAISVVFPRPSKPAFNFPHEIQDSTAQITYKTFFHYTKIMLLVGKTECLNYDYKLHATWSFSLLVGRIFLMRFSNLGLKEIVLNRHHLKIWMLIVRERNYVIRKLFMSKDLLDNCLESLSNVFKLKQNFWLLQVC